MWTPATERAEPRSSSPQELTAFVAEQLEAYRRGAQAMKLSLD